MLLGITRELNPALICICSLYYNLLLNSWIAESEATFWLLKAKILYLGLFFHESLEQSLVLWNKTYPICHCPNGHCDRRKTFRSLRENKTSNLCTFEINTHFFSFRENQLLQYHSVNNWSFPIYLHAISVIYRNVNKFCPFSSHFFPCSSLYHTT